jgi:hypothetical protein
MELTCAGRELHGTARWRWDLAIRPLSPIASKAKLADSPGPRARKTCGSPALCHACNQRRRVGPLRAEDFGLRAEVGRPGAEIASMLIHLGASARCAPATSGCARMSMRPLKIGGTALHAALGQTQARRPKGPARLPKHLGAGGRRGVVELLHLDVVHEFPLTGEGPLVVPGDLVECHPAGSNKSWRSTGRGPSHRRRYFSGQSESYSVSSRTGCTHTRARW